MFGFSKELFSKYGFPDIFLSPLSEYYNEFNWANINIQKVTPAFILLGK